METFLDPGARIFQGTRFTWEAPWDLRFQRSLDVPIPIPATYGGRNIDVLTPRMLSRPLQPDT